MNKFNKKINGGKNKHYEKCGGKSIGQNKIKNTAITVAAKSKDKEKI